MSPYEVLATYAAMAASVALFGIISVAASSYFTRTIAATTISYLVILPLALVGAPFYAMTFLGLGRLVAVGVLYPAGCLAAGGMLLGAASRRPLHPPDVGARPPTSSIPCGSSRGRWAW